MTPAPAQPLRSQAERVLARFGGARPLARSLALVRYPLHYTTIYKWTYPIERGGTGGVIPSKAMTKIKRAAAMEGIVMRPEDYSPEMLP